MLDCTKILQIPYEGMGYMVFVSVDTIVLCLIYERYTKKKKMTCRWIKAHVWKQNMTMLDNEFSHLDRDTFVD